MLLSLAILLPEPVLHDVVLFIALVQRIELGRWYLILPPILIRESVYRVVSVKHLLHLARLCLLRELHLIRLRLECLLGLPAEENRVLLLAERVIILNVCVIFDDWDHFLKAFLVLLSEVWRLVYILNVELELLDFLHFELGNLLVQNICCPHPLACRVDWGDLIYLLDFLIVEGRSVLAFLQLNRVHFLPLIFLTLCPSLLIRLGLEVSSVSQVWRIAFSVLLLLFLPLLDALLQDIRDLHHVRVRNGLLGILLLKSILLRVWTMRVIFLPQDWLPHHRALVELSAFELRFSLTFELVSALRLLSSFSAPFGALRRLLWKLRLLRNHIIPSSFPYSELELVLIERIHVVFHPVLFIPINDWLELLSREGKVREIWLLENGQLAVLMLFELRVLYLAEVFKRRGLMLERIVSVLASLALDRAENRWVKAGLLIRIRVLFVPVVFIVNRVLRNRGNVRPLTFRKLFDALFYENRVSVTGDDTDASAIEGTGRST